MDGGHPVGVLSHRFTVGDYHRMDAAGLFPPGTKVQLVDGVVLQMPALGLPHVLTVNRLTMLLAPRLVGRAVVAVQNAIRIDDFSEPEPDVAVLEYPSGLERRPVARDALLIIEVANTSLPFDRSVKRRVYAENAVREYWIVDLAGAAVEVHRMPVDGAYTDVRTISSGAIAIDALPDVVLSVADILPPPGV